MPRRVMAVVLAMSVGAACSSPSNDDKNLSTSAPASGESGAGATGGMTSGGMHAGGSGGKASGGAGSVAAGAAAGTESGGAGGCSQQTEFPFYFYPNCDGTPQTVCVENPPSIICYCDSTTSLDGSAPIRLPRSFGLPCPGAGGRGADAGVTDAGPD